MAIAGVPSTGTSSSIKTQLHTFSSSSSPPLPTRTTLPLRPHNHTYFTLHCSNSLFLHPLQTLKSYKSIPKNRRFNLMISMSMEADISVMGTKLGMITFFKPNGIVVPVTVVGFREDNIVTQAKIEATDGYDVVQVGFRRVTDQKLTKPEMGHLEKSGIIPMRHLHKTH